MEKTVQFLKDAKIFFIATIDGDRPRVRPFGALNVYNNKLYFISANTKDVFNQLVKNNNTEICACTPDGRWIRISGKVEVDNSIEAKKAMLDANPDLRMMYNENDGIMEVFFLKNATSTISSFTEAPIIEKL